MSKFNKKLHLDKAELILKKISSVFPNAQTELENWETPFQFLICVLLSAQTTDKQVNKVTKTLFKNYPTPNSIKETDIKSITNIIKSINYYNSKAKHIVSLSKIIVEKYKGEVPSAINELITLPGVGYKTANVFINVIYPDISQGIAVDTHVDRVVKRIGLITDCKLPPDKVAHQLEKIYKRHLWKDINSTYVLFGRYICTARNPKCKECILNKECEFYNDIYKSNK